MHVNGTAKEAHDRISTPKTSQAVRGNSDLPARARGAASALPPAPHSPRHARLSAVTTRPDQCGISRHHLQSRKCRRRSPGPRCDTCKIDLRRNHQNYHRREADVEVSTAHAGASRTETIRRIGGLSSAAQRLGRKSARPEGAVRLLLQTTFNQKSTCTKSIRARSGDLARSWRLPDAGPRPRRNVQQPHSNRRSSDRLHFRQSSKASQGLPTAAIGSSFESQDQIHAIAVSGVAKEGCSQQATLGNPTIT